MPVLGHGVKFWEHFQAADTQAFLLQPGGQSQRREFLLGQRSQVDFLPLTKTGKEIRRRAVQSRAGRLGQFFWRLDSIAPPLEYCGWHGSWHPRICRSHSGPRTGNLRPGPVRPGIRRFLRTYQNSVSDDLISFLLQGKKRKPRTFSSMSPACACWLFSVVRSKLRNSSRISPRMADSRASCSWALHTIRHTASVRCPAGMELRIRQASRCWGDVREKERLSRRLSAMADTPRHLPHKALISFGIQGYVIQDKRAAQAVCGRKVAL